MRADHSYVCEREVTTWEGWVRGFGVCVVKRGLLVVCLVGGLVVGGGVRTSILFECCRSERGGLGGRSNRIAHSGPTGLRIP